MLDTPSITIRKHPNTSEENNPENKILLIHTETINIGHGAVINIIVLRGRQVARGQAQNKKVNPNERKGQSHKDLA